MKLLILNVDQAKALADAMAALNNVGMRLHARLNLEDEEHNFLHVSEYEDGSIFVFIGSADASRVCHEPAAYPSQSHFLAAYGL